MEQKVRGEAKAVVIVVVLLYPTVCGDYGN